MWIVRNGHAGGGVGVPVPNHADIHRSVAVLEMALDEAVHGGVCFRMLWGPASRAGGDGRIDVGDINRGGVERLKLAVDSPCNIAEEPVSCRVLVGREVIDRHTPQAGIHSWHGLVLGFGLRARPADAQEGAAVKAGLAMMLFLQRRGLDIVHRDRVGLGARHFGCVMGLFKREMRA